VASDHLPLLVEFQILPSKGHKPSIAYAQE
jgi:hypothetical protein